MTWEPGPGGCFSNSDGPSDWATDHRPMLFVHSRMVRHRSDGPSLLVGHPHCAEDTSYVRLAISGVVKKAW